jgi:hypothetical protein
MRRFSIRSLMAFVLVSAIGLAALRNASDLWAGMMLLLALAIVGTALMAAVILRGQERHGWAGFAFFGGGYLALAFAPGLSDTSRHQLGTTFILNGIYSRMMRGTSQNAGDLPSLRTERERLTEKLREAAVAARTGNDPAVMAAKRAIGMLNRQIDAISGANYDQFERVGHSLFALLAGLLGGMIGLWLYGRRERNESGAG